jgi:four helix bundle protein
MTYARFEDLPVWKAAVELAVAIDRVVQDRAVRAKGDLVNQLERAALSISNNIAEGFERGTTAELIYYLYVARGSAGEVRSALQVAARLCNCEHLSEQINQIVPQCESISRQLRGWADSLQNSEIKGQKHLNEVSRGEWDRAKRSAAFVERLAAIREAGAKGEKTDPKSGI